MLTTKLSLSAAHMMENIFSSPAIFSFKYSQYSLIGSVSLGVGIGGVALIFGCAINEKAGIQNLRRVETRRR